MWELIVIVVFVLVALLYAQDRHYSYLQEKIEWENSLELDAELEKKLKEFDEYKKRVDALTLKAGFKL